MSHKAPEYLAINRANWDSRVPFHLEGYSLDRFRSDPGYLSGVVRFDQPRLGGGSGLEALHLQCHIGTDTPSLARLGARMTGFDFLGASLEAARTLAADCGANIDYVLSDVYGALDVLGRDRFDLVYTGVAALCWLPDVRRWAQVIAGLLKPGRRFFIREGHPLLWALCDPRQDQLLTVEFPYFEVAGGTPFRETSTYVDHEGELASPDSISFNHGLAEIFNVLWQAGLHITLFEEHESVPWNVGGDAMVEDEL